MDHFGKVIVYPPTIEEFETRYPEIFSLAFSDTAPVACPVNETALEQLRLRLPARSTHQAISYVKSGLRMMDFANKGRPLALMDRMHLWLARNVF